MFTYTRKVQYHETDKMGITHHSNYVKWMEEARVAWLESIGYPYQVIEGMGIASPVTGLEISYKHPTTFGDVVEIETAISKYTGVKLEVSYTIRNITTGTVAAIASSKHCFMKGGKIISLKREEPDMHEAFMNETVSGSSLPGVECTQ